MTYRLKMWENPSFFGGVSHPRYPPGGLPDPPCASAYQNLDEPQTHDGCIEFVTSTRRFRGSFDVLMRSHPGRV